MASDIDKGCEATQLRAGITWLALEIDEYKINLLLGYVKLLLKWNKFYNLTAITDYSQIIKLHILDGLTIIPYLNGGRDIIDVGSGMGVPGIIIAIWCPDKQVCAIDSNHKKTAFLRQVAIELGITNFKVICSKVEDYQVEHLYNLVISRAFSSSRIFINLTRHLLAPKGEWMLMKSHKVGVEVDSISEYKHSLTSLSLPGSLDTRYLLKIANDC